ncbi:MAG: GntR family transcriptional regulator [Verrucomicrobia bacterium]|nr:GntR family transcriptional regulator [Verrucomicrobiota bacterium]
MKHILDMGRGSGPLVLTARLAERVREAIRAEIQSGRWDGDLPPERRIAQEFQVSRPTLHMALRALQKEGLLRTQPRQPWRVARSVCRAGTGRRFHGSSKRDRRPDVVMLRYGRVKPNLTNVMFLTDPLQRKLHALGYGLRIVDPFAHGTKGVEKTLFQWDAEHRPAYYLLASVPPVIHRWFEARKIPTMIFGSRDHNVRMPALDLDTEATVRHAVEHLLRRGHRQIALLNLPSAGVVGARITNETFLRICAHEARRGARGFIQSCAARPAAVEAAIRRMFARAHPPTAVLVTGDFELVISLYTMLPALGLRIPRDVSVLVLGHSPLLDFLRPFPACYKFSWEQWASRIARIIRNHARLGLWPTKFWKVIPTLREGDSVATRRVSD